MSELGHIQKRYGAVGLIGAVLALIGLVFGLFTLVLRMHFVCLGIGLVWDISLVMVKRSFHSIEKHDYA